LGNAFLGVEVENEAARTRLLGRPGCIEDLTTPWVRASAVRGLVEAIAGGIEAD
jgi:hypothetical protein